MNPSNVDMLDVAKQALESGSELNIAMHDVPYEEAERIIQGFADHLDRTWQEQEYEGIKWLQVVPHDTDQLNISIFYT